MVGFDDIDRKHRQVVMKLACAECSSTDNIATNVYGYMLVVCSKLQTTHPNLYEQHAYWQEMQDEIVPLCAQCRSRLS